MSTTSVPSRKTPLKATAKPTPSCRPGRAGVLAAAAADSSFAADLGHGGGKDPVLVMRVLVAARSQNRLAQPRQSEHQQQRPHDHPQRVERDVADQRHTHDEDEHAQHDGGRRGAFQRRAPAPAHAGGDHDGQSLDHLHQAGGEHGQDQDEGGRGVHLGEEPTGDVPGPRAAAPTVVCGSLTREGVV